MTGTADANDGDRRGRSGWGVAVAATLGMSVSYIDRQTLASIAPAVRAGLAIDHTHYGWLISAFSMAYLVGAPTMGVVVDRIGARKGFTIAVIVWSAVAGLHALATTFAALFALRFFLGLAEAPSFPAAAQSIRRALPGARRPAAYGLLFTGSSIGAVIAAPLAIALEARHGFRFAFVGTAIVGTAWIPFWLFATRGGRIPKDAAPIASESRADVAPAPKWLDVVRSPPVLRAVVAVIGSAPALMFVLNWSSQYFVEAWHLERTAIGGYLIVPPLLFDVGAVGFGFLATTKVRGLSSGTEGRAETPSLLVATAMVLASLLACAPLAPSPAVAAALFGAAAAGGGGLYVLVTNDMLGRVPLAHTSVAGGMTAAAQSLAHIIASPLVGWAVDRSHQGKSYGASLVALGLVVVPATLVFLAWPSLRGAAPKASRVS